MAERVIHKILVPIELVEEREADATYAIRLAAQLRADLLLVAVIDTPAAAAMIARHKGRHPRGAGFHEVLVQEAKAVLEDLVAQAAEHDVQAWGHVTVSEEVEEQILKEAIMQKVDLILVRSHGRSGISKALLGSTAGEILKAAPCPVLVSRV